MGPENVALQNLARSSRKGRVLECRAGQLLEVPDQLLASSHEVAVLDAAAGHAAVDALDELAVLAADLVVEGHQLVDPRLVHVRAEEVVEEAVRPIGRERHDRPDRDVRPARVDYHAETRPNV